MWLRLSLSCLSCFFSPFEPRVTAAPRPRRTPPPPLCTPRVLAEILDVMVPRRGSLGGFSRAQITSAEPGLQGQGCPPVHKSRATLRFAPCTVAGALLRCLTLADRSHTHIWKQTYASTHGDTHTHTHTHTHKDTHSLFTELKKRHTQPRVSVLSSPFILHDLKQTLSP